MVRPNLYYCQRCIAALHRNPLRLAIVLVMLTLALLALSSTTALAQDPTAPGLTESGVAGLATGALAIPSLWYLFAAGLAMLVPAGFVLLGSSDLEEQHAWNAALGGLAAAGLAIFAYWAFGFALQFGGVGLVYDHPELRGQVWEWSPLSTEWGIGWGMAGLTGWFLSGPMTALSYTLFLGHAPWVMLAALLPVMTLRGRAPALVTLLLAVFIGGIVYPLAGNWVQGGGWLNALGRNMNLGHGFVDFAGAGSVHLVAAGFALAALTVWSTRRRDRSEVELPPAHQPLLAVVGALLILGGNIGWMFANPLQVESIGPLGMMRGSVAALLAAAGGIVFPLLYTWFVTGRSEPTMTARGFVAGVVAGLACAPFVAPGIAFVIGLLAGLTVPFVTFLLDGRLRLDDRSGVVISSGVPAMIGLLLVGIFADGAAGSGWQATGIGNYLGVAGQGVSGLTVASGYQLDFPGQLQAQVIGVAALGLWGFLAGLIVCVPLGLLFHSLLRRNDRPTRAAVPANAAPMMASGTKGTTTSMAVVATTTQTLTPTSMPAPMPTTTESQRSVPLQTAGTGAPISIPAASETTLPGFAPGERRVPPGSVYVAPAVSTAPIINPEPVSPPVSPNLSTQLEYSAPGATAAEAGNITPLSDQPREGYWPSPVTSASASTMTSGATPDESAYSAPAYSYSGTPAPTEGVTAAPYAATDPYQALENPTEYPKENSADTQPYTSGSPAAPKASSNPLSPLGRRRTSSLSDDTSAASV